MEYIVYIDLLLPEISECYMGYNFYRIKSIVTLIPTYDWCC